MTEHEWKPARKKPVEVEYRGPYSDTDTIETIEGDFEVDEEYLEDHGGYVIIRGGEGEEYPCGADIFYDTYIIEAGGFTSSQLYELWKAKAIENVDKWGLQREETLLLAIQEELGELTQAHLESKHEDGEDARIDDELDDLGALLLQLHSARQNSSDNSEEQK